MTRTQIKACFQARGGRGWRVGEWAEGRRGGGAEGRRGG